MTCNEAMELAPLYLSRELEGERAAELGGHIEACAVCAREIARQMALDSRLRAAVQADEIDTGSLETRVRGAIAGERGRAKWRYAWMVAAASLLVVAGGVVLRPGQTPALFVAAEHDHRVELVDKEPRRWRKSVAEIAALAESQGVAGASVATLAPAGFRLEQGRLCRLNGDIFVHLVYAGDGGSFSVFVRKAAGEPGVVEDARRVRGEQVAAFHRGALAGLIVTRESSAATSRLAELFSRGA